MNVEVLQEKVEEALSRIERLEVCVGSQGDADAAWRFLVNRPHPWRRQLNVKGRNLTVGQLLTTIRANNLTLEQASEDLDLPLEAVREALEYGKRNHALIAMEAQEERRRLMERGIAIEPQTLP